MPSHFKTILLLSALAATVGCKGPNSALREFVPPIVGENDVIKAEVRKVYQKKRSLRVWMNLQNKTDDTLRLNYSDITATADGRTVHGALRIPFMRVNKEFDMPRKFYKTINQPIEFLDLPRLQNVEVTITNIRIDGEGDAPDLEITLPVRDPPKADPEN